MVMEKFQVFGMIHEALDIILLPIFFRRKKFLMNNITYTLCFKHSFVSMGNELIMEFLNKKLYFSFERNS